MFWRKNIMSTRLHIMKVNGWIYQIPKLKSILQSLKMWIYPFIRSFVQSFIHSKMMFSYFSSIPVNNKLNCNQNFRFSDKTVIHSKYLKIKISVFELHIKFPTTWITLSVIHKCNRYEKFCTQKKKKKEAWHSSFLTIYINLTLFKNEYFQTAFIEI